MPKPPEQKSDTSALDLLILGLLLVIILPIIGGFFVRLFTPTGSLLEVRAFFAPFFERNMVWLQLGSIFLSIIFMLGIIYAMVKPNWFEIRWQDVLDFMGPGYVEKRRPILVWRKILRWMSFGNQKDWKLAIVAADDILNELFKMAGYLGSRMDDKFGMITSAQLSNIEDIKKAHATRNKIEDDPDFQITQEEAEKIIDVYKKSFVELRLIRG